MLSGAYRISVRRRGLRNVVSILNVVSSISASIPEAIGGARRIPVAATVIPLAVVELANQVAPKPFADRGERMVAPLKHAHRVLTM